MVQQKSISFVEEGKLKKKKKIVSSTLKISRLIEMHEERNVCSMYVYFNVKNLLHYVRT